MAMSLYTLDASAEPTIIIESISSGAVANKKRTGIIIISGTSNALEGQKIQIMDGTAVVAEDLVSSEGRWSATVENLIDGGYDLTLAPDTPPCYWGSHSNQSIATGL